jgi:steroid 5-alpha reductase family enzyme
MNQSDLHTTYALVTLAVCTVINVAAYFVERSTGLNAVQAVSGACVAVACVMTMLLRGTCFPRQVISTLLMSCWGFRLSWYLVRRGQRRDQAFVLDRILWASLVALPVVLCNTMQDHAYRSTGIEVFAVAVAFTGLCIETAADYWKHEWFTLAPTERPGPVCTSGLWHYSRHPNLFGEIMFQWGIYFIVRPVDNWLIILCPLYTTLQVLFMPGGMLTQEAARAKRFGTDESYITYRITTPPIIPFWPKLYAKMNRGECSPLLCCNFDSHV